MSYESGKNLGHYSMYELFCMEVENQVDKLNNDLLEIEAGDHSDKTIEDVLRSAHSIKGAARMVNVEVAIRLSHGIEECLIAFRDSGLSFSDTQMDTMFSVVDLLTRIADVPEQALPEWLSSYGAQVDAAESLLCGIVQELGRNCSQNKSSGVVTRDQSELSPSIPEELDREADTAFKVAGERLGKIHGLSSEALVESHRQDRVLEKFRQLKRQHFGMVEQVARLGNMMQVLALDETSRNQYELISRLTIRMRKEFSDSLDEFENMARRHSTLLDNLHHEVMSTRMRPISEYLGGLPRYVRDISRKLDKKVELYTSGLGTLVDREVLERIDTPVKHIIQNCIDHGIETPENRLKQGKPETANLKIEVSQAAGMLFIVIEDDGRGIDFEGIRRRLVEQERMTDKKADSLDDNRLLDYLFETGFSTRNETTSISGRGIGLDLVKQALQLLGGSVYVQTEVNVGTRFQLIVPQVVSIVRCVIFDIEGERYALPVARIHNITTMSEKQIATRDDGQYFRYQDEIIPLVHANQVFGQAFHEVKSGVVNVLILGEAGQRVALAVEDLYEQQELSTRRLDIHLGKVRDISGAAVLQDGRLALVIDAEEYIASIYELLAHNLQLPVWTHGKASELDGLRVLVVDDSLTAREMERKLLQHEHCEVITAHNGVEAWKMLQARHFDLLVSDIDMPEMDGFELLQHLRASDSMVDTPVLLISHRERVAQLRKLEGISNVAFLSKSEFSGHLFLERVRDLIRRPVKGEPESGPGQ